MPINPEVRDAVVAAVKKLDQPKKVGDILCAWLDGIADGEIDPTDAAQVGQKIDLLVKTIKVQDTES